MKVMVLLLVFLLVDGIASVCMSTNGTTQGLSVYQRVCCVINNLGRSHTIKENGCTVGHRICCIILFHIVHWLKRASILLKLYVHQAANC